MTESNNTPLKYWAFISYRHADNRAPGRQWATWLHQMLENYQVPEDLVGTENGRGEIIPQRIFPVFRDEEELPVDADLESPIYRALDSSKFLIVICSPRARQSPYVAAEINYFKKIGRSQNVLALMIDGEPNVSLDKGKQNYGFHSEDECFPEPLQFEVDRNGTLTEKRTEPIAGDLRTKHKDGQVEEGWTSIEAYKQHLQSTGLRNKEIQSRVQIYEKQLEIMKLKIIAGVLGVSLGELTRRDKAYQLKQAKRKALIFRRVAAVMVVLFVLAVVGGVFSYLQMEKAKKQEVLAVIAQKEAVYQKENAERQKEYAEQLLNVGRIQFAGQKYEEGDIKNGDTFFKSIPESKFKFLKPLLRDRFHNEKLSITGHKEYTQSVHFSPNGKIFASVGDREIKIWNTETGELTRTIPVDISLSKVLFSPDGQTIAVLSAFDGIIILFDQRSGKLKTLSSGQDGLSDIEFSPDGKIFATAGYQGVKLWAAETGEVINEYFISSRSFSKKLAFHPSGKFLAVAEGSELFLYDIRNPKEMKAITKKLKEKEGVDIAFLEYFSASSEDSFGNPEDPFSEPVEAGDRFSESDEPEDPFNSPEDPFGSPEDPLDSADLFIGPLEKSDFPILRFDKSIRKIKFGSFDDSGDPFNNDSGDPFFNDDTGDPFGNSDVLAIAFSDKVELLEFKGQAVGKKIILEGFNNYNSTDFSQNVSGLVSATENRIKLWNASSDEPINTFTGHSGEIVSLDLSSDGSMIVTADRDNTIKVWDTKSYKALRYIQGKSATFNSTGKAVACISYNSLVVVDAVTNQLIKSFPVTAELDSLTFSPDGNLITENSDKTLSVWELKSGRKVKNYPGSIIKMGPDGRALIRDKKAIRLWDTGSKREPIEIGGNLRHIFSEKSEYSRDKVDISVNGFLLTWSESNNALRLWSLESGNEIISFKDKHEREKAITSLGFSPDGKTFASCSDKKVTLWETLTGKEVKSFIGHKSSIHGVSFSPDGRSLISIGEDSVKFWDVLTGQELYSFKDEKFGWIESVEFSSDSKVLFFRTENGIFYYVYDYNSWSHNHYIQEITRLKSLGIPVAYDDAFPDQKVILDINNAAIDLKGITQFIEKMKESSELDTVLRVYYGNGPLGKSNSAGDFRLLKEVEKERIRKISDGAEVQKIIDLLLKASVKTEFKTKVDKENPYATLLPHLSGVRNGVKLLTFKAVLEAEKGNEKEAVDLYISSLRLCNFIFKDPFLISHLLTVASIKISNRHFQALLRKKILDKESLEQMEIVHKKLLDGRKKSLHRSFLSEFIIASHIFLNVINGKNFPDGLFDDIPPISVENAKIGHLFLLNNMDFCKNMADFPYRKLLNEPVKEFLNTSPENDVILHKFLEGIGLLSIRSYEAQAYLQQALVAIELEYWHLKNNSYPKKLTDLKIERSLLIDPFSEKEFEYTAGEKGFTLRSRGHEGKEIIFTTLGE